MAQKFVERHVDTVVCSIACFHRLIFKGYLQALAPVPRLRRIREQMHELTHTGEHKARGHGGFNPAEAGTIALFLGAMKGEYILKRFRDRNVAHALYTVLEACVGIYDDDIPQLIAAEKAAQKQYHTKQSCFEGSALAWKTHAAL